MRLAFWPLALATAALALTPATPRMEQSASSSVAQTIIRRTDVPALTVRFDGGDIPANATRVLDVLRQLRLLQTKTAYIEKGQTVCQVYLEKTDFPLGCSKDLVVFADQLNRSRVGERRIQIGDRVLYPDVKFARTTFARRFDPKVPGDRQALEDIRLNWTNYITSYETLPSGIVKVNLLRYELQVPIRSPEDAERATRALQDAHIANITFTHPDEQKRVLRYNSIISPTKYVSACQAGTLGTGDQCAYSLLVGLDRVDWVRCTSKCPDVFLLDRPVRKHPALVSSVADGWGDDDDPGTTNPSACSLAALKETDHGTHLAGIIGASGPTCVGLYPAARIHSWNREVDAADTSLDIEGVQGRFEHNGATVGLPIFVFASSWQYADRNGQAGVNLDHAEDRFRHPFAAAIETHASLWVVAAGQADRGRKENAVEITDRLALGPMNLGDQRNVVVVTACLDCASERPELRPHANYSNTFVHVAAPGDDMPGIAGERRLGIGGGTSQAAAFVAGIASAMVSRYPDSFSRPEYVKSRLQYTSRPVFEGQDAKRLAAGVIDPAVAMLDPEKDFLVPLVGTTREIEIDKWCSATLELFDPTNGRRLESGPVYTRDIFRMYRVNRADPGAKPQWIVYTKKPWKPGEVVRIGPAVLAGGRPGQPAPLFMEKGARGVSPGSFFDLLVHDPVSKAPGCGT